MADQPLVRKHSGDFHWEGVDVLAYKQEGSAPFKDVTRQVLFDSTDPPAQLRYFEVAPGGHTTLERHEHVHSVMVIRGRGQCLVGDRAYELGANSFMTKSVTYDGLLLKLQTLSQYWLEHCKHPQVADSDNASAVA